MSGTGARSWNEERVGWPIKASRLASKKSKPVVFSADMAVASSRSVGGPPSQAIQTYSRPPHRRGDTVTRLNVLFMDGSGRWFPRGEFVVMLAERVV